MQNQENVPGNEPQKNPTREGQNTEKRSGSEAPQRRDTEINPSKFDETEVDLDRDGIGSSEGGETRESFEFGEESEGEEDEVQNAREAKAKPSEGKNAEQKNLGSQRPTSRPDQKQNFNRNESGRTDRPSGADESRKVQ